jgi:serine phosphatase RsbU (regulator of sigma subunit)
LHNRIKYILIYFLIVGSKFLCAQQSDKYCDSLLEIVKSAKEDTVKIGALNKIGRHSINVSMYENAIKYAEQAKDIAAKLSNQKEVGNSFNIIGDARWYEGNYVAAFNNYFEALRVFEKTGDKLDIANCNRNIGWIYINQQEYDKALDYFQKTLIVSEELNKKDYVGMICGDMGSLYLRTKNYTKSLEYYKASLKIYTELGDKHNIGIHTINIGSIYDLTGNYKRALYYYIKGSEMAKAENDILAFVVSNYNIGNIYTKQGDFDAASDYFDQAIKLAQEIGYKEGIMSVYYFMAELNIKKNDYKQALEYHKLFLSLKDSLLNEQSNKQITEMNTRYESTKKEKDIQLLTKDKSLQQAEISRQKLIRNVFIAGFGVILALAFVLFNRFKVTQKQKKIIEYQNGQIVESINYSKKIQDSFLPSIESMQKNIPRLFVFNEPKNIVSGDFYFFKEFKNSVLLACVDCAGHGVTGGFMSTIGNLLLDKIVDDESLSPSEILSKLSNEIIQVLQRKNGGEIKTEMDLSVCLIDVINHKIDFCGARNGLIVVSNSEVKRYEGSQLSVGGNYLENGASIVPDFKTHSISLSKNDWIYMYTDGFTEQIGGTEGIPMTQSQFESHLINLSKHNEPNEQHKLLKSILNEWQGKNERTDDILIIGFQHC